MRPKLLKMLLRDGRLALGASAGLVVGRMIVNRATKKLERHVQKQQETMGAIDPATEKRLRVYRIARGILNIL